MLVALFLLSVELLLGNSFCLVVGVYTERNMAHKKVMLNTMTQKFRNSGSFKKYRYLIIFTNYLIKNCSNFTFLKLVHNKRTKTNKQKIVFCSWSFNTWYFVNTSKNSYLNWKIQFSFNQSLDYHSLHSRCLMSPTTATEAIAIK